MSRRFYKNTLNLLYRQNRHIFTYSKNSLLSSGRFSLKNQKALYYVKPKQKKGPSARGWIIFGAGMASLTTAAVTYLGFPDPSLEQDPYKNESLPLQYIYRTRDKIWDFYEMFAEPSSKLLLPEPLQEPYIQPPYTLILEMTDTLVHPEYDRKSGWRFRKRPGIEFFLNSLGPPLFEIVIFTHEVGFSASPVIDGIDPNGMIMYRLFRDATNYVNGTHVKDLSCINRDLKKVIVIDCNKSAAKYNERNAIILKKWEGDPKDTTLFDLVPLLQTIATSNIEDVRTVLDFYKNEEDIVAAFKRNQARLLEAEKARQEQANQSQSSSWSGVFGRGLFGKPNKPS
ncbi:mitochondrial import inner membrane translocase subunit TIM50-like [Actinia tenebrosa]|uniref:Mitochondrial import inner membrane translocase subunit TIM50 n=1 Tax=Actinia tenebrosa TaxID=6105 RepID=A0A6P8IEK4_ACTTE|nr:mitochondrial import inner membrane translocase subunit TIM50-like [Actinia tenebrosa]